MRQALFDEFQQIEWQARVEAIRERLDEQRRERQEQEREQEQEAERQAQEQQAQVDRQAVQVQQERARMSANLQWQGTGFSLESSAIHICLSFGMWWSSRGQELTGTHLIMRMSH